MHPGLGDRQEQPIAEKCGDPETPAPQTATPPVRVWF